MAAIFYKLPLSLLKELVVVAERPYLEIVVAIRLANQNIVLQSKRETVAHLVFVVFERHLYCCKIIGPKFWHGCILTRVKHLQ